MEKFNVIQIRAHLNKMKGKVLIPQMITRFRWVTSTKKNIQQEKTRQTPPTRNKGIDKTKTTYNVMDNLNELQITFPFLEVVKIPQKRENILKYLENKDVIDKRVEAIVIGLNKYAFLLLWIEEKVPPFYIYLETSKFVLHNCLIDGGATNNIMQLYIMLAIGLDYTKYYQTWEIICSTDSRKVPSYGEIKVFLCINKVYISYYHCFYFNCGRIIIKLWYVLCLEKFTYFSSY